MDRSSDSPSIVLMEHELVARKQVLRETKEMVLVRADDGDKEEEEGGTKGRVFVDHTRAIGDRRVTERTRMENRAAADKAVIHNLKSRGAVEEFEKDWKRLWQPKIKEEEGNSAIKRATEIQPLSKDLGQSATARNITLDLSKHISPFSKEAYSSAGKM